MLEDMYVILQFYAGIAGAPQYHTTQVGCFGMTGNAETFCEGARWFRNSMDLARQYRDTAIAQANEVANTRYGEVSETSADATHEAQSQETIAMQHDSDTSLDELALDADLPRKRPSRLRPARPRKRTTAGSSAGRSTASESWTCSEGGYHCFRGRTKVASQGEHPRDVWVYNRTGWRNGGGKQWCLYGMDGTIEYR